jgi:NADH-quinone oxidoreductase subunit G
MTTVTLTIDGRAITVEKGKTVLQAAIESGISVPYYCYHPGIGIDGSCRVCIVKIEKMPKLQTSCSTVCNDGMVVDTQSPEVAAARAGVFEFLLVNHPLDCPVCDKGGECPLQDFSYRFGPDASRMEFPRRVFDGDGAKADVDFGPTLMLNRNRCILCTRCVRFMRDVEGDAQINIIDRGYGSEIATFQEQGVHSLNSGNLMDVCPVGAITTRDYRFKSRPWDNATVVDTMCTQCSKGCNTTAWIKAKPEWAKGSSLIRFTPRFNPDVNGYWMCDIGRFDYHWVEGSDRLRQPLARDERGVQRATSWPEVMAALGARMAAGRGGQGLRFLLSAHASNEELFVFRQLCRELFGEAGADRTALSWRFAPKAQPAATTFKVASVDAPNVSGARLLGLVPGDVADIQGPADVSALRAAVAGGQVSALYVFDPGPAGSLGDVQWIVDARREGRLPLLIVHAVLHSALTTVADFVLPGASFAEKDASYTNDAGRLQGTARALAPPGDALEDWRIVKSLGEALGVTLGYEDSTQIRAAIERQCAGAAGLAGIDRLESAQPTTAKHWLQSSNPSERWKWDFMFQDLPPVKGSVDPIALPPPPGLIPIREVTLREKAQENARKKA